MSNEFLESLKVTEEQAYEAYLEEKRRKELEKKKWQKVDKEPTKENIEKIEKLLESSKQEKSLGAYYRNVKFNRAEIVTVED